MRFAREAWPFVVPFLLAALALAIVGQGRWAAAVAVLGLLVLLFFRDPPRRFSGDPAVVVAAADGEVTRVDVVSDPAVGAGSFHRVVTFLSPLDVHVQRTPVAGEVVSAVFTSGRKLPAFRPEAGEVNENHLTVLRRDNGDLVAVRQIAGAVARRVVCHLRVGDRVTRGHPMGLIKFGSRVDVLVPSSYRVEARVGQRLRNGETPVATAPAAPVAAAESRP
jgi:phosphatidylserine decarboxylase